MAPRALMQVYFKGVRTLGRPGISFQAVEKYESGWAIIDEEKLEKILKALKLSVEEYEKIRKGKGIGLRKKVKTVSTN